MLIGCWLTLISAASNRFSPPSGTVFGTHAPWAVPAACAVFPIPEMEPGFSGVIRAADAPTRAAIAETKR